jgi:CheY-like chemotaxis protein
MARILLLDDEGEIVEQLPPLLKDKGLEITGTVSIPEALALLGKEPFDAVLLDIMMTLPESMQADAEKLDYGRETGVEVARQMKEIKPGVPIVAFTALTDPEIRARMREAGIVETLSKPAELTQVADVLLRVLRTRK